MSKKRYINTVSLALISGSAIAAGLAVVSQSAHAAGEESTVLQEVTVTGTREGELRSETPNSITAVRGDVVDDLKPAHPLELMTRVPGAAIVQTSGEGHTTGLRHPIGTASVYLYLEDGVPTRASGFFNHNALYEVNLPQSDGIEVIRGPGTALQGSDAVGGIFNVLTRAPSETEETTATAEMGTYGWARGLGSYSNTWGDLGIRSNANLTHSDGWRDATRYDRQSASLRADKVLSGDSMMKVYLTATHVDQQSSGTSTLTRQDYDNNPTTNYTPNAYRRVNAVRASLAWEKETGPSLVSLTPYFRWNNMDLLPTWAPQTVYETGHTSLGLLAKYRRDFEPWRTRLVTGADLDYSPGYRNEYLNATTKSGNYYTSYKPTSILYDYDVTFRQISPYVHAETSPIEPLRITAGLRFDSLSYDYENNLTNEYTGNYRRPGSDTRWYSNLSPSLGFTYAFTRQLNAFANYKHSFRVPGEGDLFRQGKNIDSIHLKPVQVDNYEIGLRGPDKGDFTWELSAYHMIKSDDILSEARDGNNQSSTNNGRTRHDGIEAAVGWRFLPEWTVRANGSYAEHVYDKWTSSGVNYADKEIKTAPKVITNLTLGWQPGGDFKGLKLEAEWNHLGPYQMDDANTLSYKGHDLFNLRGSYEVTEGLELFARAMNILDTRWASSASLSGAGAEQLVPGAPLTVYAGLTARF